MSSGTWAIAPNTENDLKEYFEKYGDISGCTIHRNRETGRSRGFGFITFKEATFVDAVQNSRPHVMNNCEVRFHFLSLRGEGDQPPVRSPSPKRLSRKLIWLVSETKLAFIAT